MKKLSKLAEELAALIEEIERDFPDLYRHLEQNPVRIQSGGKAAEIGVEELRGYLENLKEQLLHYVETHDEWIQD